MRKIIHVDMDAFYASVEQRDYPDYRGKPIAVGGTSRRGVVATASYEARVFGVRSAMPSSVARRLCPQLIFVRPRFEVYSSVSRQIREIFHRYTDLVEPLSLDEAYLDVTHPKRGPASATLIARAIKEEIHTETGLTASAGVSFNKFLAKIASDMDKPDGLTIILPQDAEAVVARLPVERFHGIGPVTASKMKAMGIQTGADLRERNEQELCRHFGKAGRYFYRIARAQDNREVSVTRERKSVGAEETFEEDISDPAVLLDELQNLADQVARRMGRHGLSGRTLTLKLRYHNFEQHTRSRTFQHDLKAVDEIMAAGRLLFQEPEPPSRPVRLLGLTVSSLNSPESQPGSAQLDLPF